MVLTAYVVLSPVTGLFCHRHLRIKVFSLPVGPKKPPQDLTPASGRQDHTILPSATTSLVRALVTAHRLLENPPCNPAARSTLPRPSHPAPNVRDDHDTPLLWDGMGNVLEMIWRERKGKYFCEEDWTGGISLILFNKFGCARKRRSPDRRSIIRDGDTDESHGSLRSHPGLPAHTPPLRGSPSDPT
jgi:hypothetical protein